MSAIDAGNRFGGQYNYGFRPQQAGQANPFENRGQQQQPYVAPPQDALLGSFDRMNPNAAAPSAAARELKAQKENDPGEKLVEVRHGNTCGHCTQGVSMVPAKDAQAAKAKFNAEQRAKVVAHESAHIAFSGGLAGAMVIEQDADGTVHGGHVPIAIPGLDPKNPEDTLTKANYVVAGASAPGGDMSGADHSVAARGRALASQAQAAISQKNAQKNQPQGQPGQPGQARDPREATKPDYALSV